MIGMRTLTGCLLYIGSSVAMVQKHFRSEDRCPPLGVSSARPPKGRARPNPKTGAPTSVLMRKAKCGCVCCVCGVWVVCAIKIDFSDSIDFSNLNVPRPFPQKNLRVGERSHFRRTVGFATRPCYLGDPNRIPTPSLDHVLHKSNQISIFD